MNWRQSVTRSLLAATAAFALAAPATAADPGLTERVPRARLLDDAVLDPEIEYTSFITSIFVLVGVFLEPMHIDLTPVWYWEVDLIGVLAHGAEALEALLAKAVDALDHKYRSVVAALGPNPSTHQVNQAIEGVLAVLAKARRTLDNVDSAAKLREENEFCL